MMRDDRCDYGVLSYVKRTLQECDANVPVSMMMAVEGALPHCVIELEEMWEVDTSARYRKGFKGMIAKIKFTVTWVGELTRKASLIGKIAGASHQVARSKIEMIEGLSATFRCTGTVGAILGGEKSAKSQGSVYGGGVYKCQHFFEALIFA